MSDRINCRLCNFSTAKWITKDGKRREGFKIMTKHFESEHPDEYRKIKEYAGGGDEGDDDTFMGSY